MDLNENYMAQLRPRKWMPFRTILDPRGTIFVFKHNKIDGEIHVVLDHEWEHRDNKGKQIYLKGRGPSNLGKYLDSIKLNDFHGAQKKLAFLEGTRERISDKIAMLRREGKSEKQAVAIAYSMEKSGQLKKGGRYVHAESADVLILNSLNEE